MYKIKKSLLVSLVFVCFFVLCGFEDREEKIYVYDEADLLSEQDEEELNKKCKQASEECEIDVVVVTTDDVKGKSTRRFAEDFIVQKNIGYEDDDRVEKSAVLFLIDLDNGETYIVTTGMGILCIEDEDIETILDQIYLYIRTDYYLACSAFVDKTVDIVDDNMQGYVGEYKDKWVEWSGDYNEFEKKYVEDHENTEIRRLKDPVNCLIISVIIGIVSVSVMALNNRAKMTVNGATYMDRNEMKVNVHDDRYIRTTTTKTRINNSSSGSGHKSSSHHGGSHHSSSGRSFGGGGRRL